MIPTDFIVRYEYSKSILYNTMYIIEFNYENNKTVFLRSFSCYG